MALETGTYISDLVATNPAAADGLVDADNHFRLIKSTIKTTFPNITGAVNPTHTELNYVDGVTSAIQTQLDAKAVLASPTFTGVPAAPTAAPGTNTTQIATTAFVAAADALKANLASPALTGTPTAPTAAPATNTTQVATTAYADAIAALKADLASPTFTGVPAAPTAAGGTNTTQIATTAFVTAAVGGGGMAAASQAEQEAASSTTVAVTPGTQQFHPSAAKFWARCAGAGTLTESFNMTSVADTGQGDLDGTIATDFSSATWCLVAQIVTGNLDTTSQFINSIINVNAQDAGTFGVQCGRWTIWNGSNSNLIEIVDPTSYNIIGYGDQA